VKRVLIDTGPLVAILSNTDEQHESCLRALSDLPSPLLSCWPVITEAAWLLQATPGAVQELLKTLHVGFLEILPLRGMDAKAIAGIMERYAAIRPQLADAALVYLANREGIDTIFTLDRRDFSIYRSAQRRPFHILPQLS
jgi:uncharacterized protein